MNAEQARAALKELGEFSHVTTNTLDLASVTLHFVKYEPGARSGKFHHYESITLPREIFNKLQHELK